MITAGLRKSYYNRRVYKLVYMFQYKFRVRDNFNLTLDWFSKR